MVIELQNLSYKDIIKELDITINQGEVLALVGRCGSGKSSILNAIAHSSFKREHLGYQIQESEKLLFNKSVKKELKFNNSASDDEIMKVLERVGLDNSLLEASPFSLSGGEKRRLTISFFLFKDLKLLLLDEPTLFLDFEGVSSVIDVIKSLQKEKVSIVLSEHNLEFVSKVATRVAFIESRRIDKIYTRDEFFTLEIFKKHKLPLTNDLLVSRYLGLNALDLDSLVGGICELIHSSR